MIDRCAEFTSWPSDQGFTSSQQKVRFQFTGSVLPLKSSEISSKLMKVLVLGGDIDDLSIKIIADDRIFIFGSIEMTLHLRDF